MVDSYLHFCYNGPMSFICDYCGIITEYEWTDYLIQYGKNRCEGCMVRHLKADGRIVIERHDDKVKLSVEFDDVLFQAACKRYTTFPYMLRNIGYEPVILRYGRDWAWITYEPAVIRKLMGRGKVEDALPALRRYLMSEISLRLKNPAHGIPRPF